MNSPKIRFKGYTEDWEQRKLSEIALQTYGGGTPKTTNEEFWKGNIPWIQSSDLIEERLFNVKPRKYISQEAISKSATKLVPQNSIAIVTRVGVGKLAFMPFSYATSQDFLSLSELKIEPEFAVYALYKMMQLVSNEVQGTSIKGITKDELLAKEFLIPGGEEQKKIGVYLHNLDHLITLHQRKLEQTKTLKKYMLQKMFPQEGQKVPEIRFEGFTGDWEQRKLGDITVKIGSGKTPLGGKSAYVETGIPLIRSQNVNGDKVDFADIVYIDEATDELMANSRVYTNDVLLNITGASIGRSAVYKGLESANVNQHVCIIRPTEGHQPDFIQLNLSSDNGQKQIDASQAGGGREGLNFQEIGKMQFSFPSLNEQMTIGRYFNSLDHLITLHQREYEKLQELKKFMLQNMFV